MAELCIMHHPPNPRGDGGNIKGGLKMERTSPPPTPGVAQLVSRHNRLKYQIFGPVLFSHRTAFEIAVLLYPNHDYDSHKFQRYLNNIRKGCTRCSKKYDPTVQQGYSGYSIPYLSRRSIPGKNNRKRRHGKYEYKLTNKGKRLLCEWNYRLKLGHVELKWTGEYFNPLIKICDKNCAACPECVW